MKSFIALTFLILFFASFPKAIAQSGHPLNSIDGTPGTSVPLAPTDSVKPGEVKNEDESDVHLPGTSENEIDRDAGSSKPMPTSSKKLTHKQKIEKQDEAIYPNESPSESH
jgi:hypothetical protein